MYLRPTDRKSETQIIIKILQGLLKSIECRQVWRIMFQLEFELTFWTKMFSLSGMWNGKNIFILIILKKWFTKNGILKIHSNLF